MDKERQNEVIAKACGYKWSVPDYTSSLEAIGEARRACLTTNGLISSFMQELSKLVCIPRNNTTAWEIFCQTTYGRFEEALYGMYVFVNTSPKEQSEALVRALGLWED